MRSVRGNKIYFDDEDALVDGVRSGDKKALEMLYKKSYSNLCDFVLTFIGDPSISEELVQDLFLDIWTKREQWKPHTSLRAYLFISAKNRALDYLKKLDTERRYYKEAQIEQGNFSSSHEVSSISSSRSAEISDAINNAIDELPVEARKIFLLSKKEGLSYKEISEVLNISIKTVETQMGRSFKTFRSLLSKKFFY